MSCNPKTFLKGCAHIVLTNPRPILFTLIFAAVLIINPILAVSAAVFAFTGMIMPIIGWIEEENGEFKFRGVKLLLAITSALALTSTIIYSYNTAPPTSGEATLYALYSIGPKSTSGLTFSLILLFFVYLLEFVCITFKEGVEIAQTICQKGQVKT